jgi:hypothetical protein
MKRSLRESIELLKKMINDPMCERMNRSIVKGYLGELWIRFLLVESGENPVHRGNQSGYDLSFGTYRIDVKTSTLKRDVEAVELLNWLYIDTIFTDNATIFCMCIEIFAYLLCQIQLFDSLVKTVPEYWGWALRHKNKQKEISCTHFVCVALNKNLNPKKLYVIKSSDIERFPQSAIRQFKNVKNGFVIFPRNCSYSRLDDKPLRDYFRTCNKLVQKAIAQEINPTGKKLIESLS